jgi:arylsulfatase A-like enzyme
VRFARCIAQAPYTPHSYSSLFSSLYVADLPVRVRAHPKRGKPVSRAGLEPYHVTLAEALQAHGYVTAAIVQGWFTAAFGLDQGYDDWLYEGRRVSDASEAAIDWLRSWRAKHSDRPFFLFTYAWSVHSPFMLGQPPDAHVFGGDPQGFNFSSGVISRYRKGELKPSAQDLENALTLYDEGIYWADRAIEPLLEALEELDLAHSTVIVFVSDHGEEFGEHGYLSHGQSNFRSVADVPLVIFDPRQPDSGLTVETPVMNIDVMPTILDLAGAPIPLAAKGLSLLPSLRGEPQPELERRALYAEGAWNGFVGAVTVGRFTFLLDEKGERHLYDWHADPGETRNLASQYPDQARRLEFMLIRHKFQGLATQQLLARDTGMLLDNMGLPRPKAAPPPGPGGTPAPLLDEEAVEQLRALGYLQ